MMIKLFLLSTLLAYGVIVSQSFMYILALRDVQISFGPASYIEFRKHVDTSMRKKFGYVVYTALFANLALVLSTVSVPDSLLFVTALVSFAALVTDTWLTVKGNMPVNKIINTWTVENYPPDWTDLRATWLRIFRYRQIANITGFVILLIGVVFG